jgi:hypothetical protein
LDDVEGGGEEGAAADARVERELGLVDRVAFCRAAAELALAALALEAAAREAVDDAVALTVRAAFELRSRLLAVASSSLLVRLDLIGERSSLI